MTIRLAQILAGGYDERVRKLPQETRRLVFERDRCRKCGLPGTKIDYISGPSPELENHQLLCFDCHRDKTMQSLRVTSPDEDPEMWAKADALDQRVKSFDPVRICDSPDWNAMWRSVLSARRQAVEVLTSRNS